MKVVTMHGEKTHKGIEVKGKWAPLCQPKIWLRNPLAGGPGVIEAQDGDESMVDCKKCRNKMAKARMK